MTIQGLMAEGRYANTARRKTPRKVSEPGDRRCWNCDKYLFKVIGFTGRIEITCRGCRRTNVITGNAEQADGLASPDVAEIFAAMERRWEQQSKARSVRRAEMAVGLRFSVFMRDGFCCRYCGMGAGDGAILHADHVMPASKGGPTTIDNLVTSCLECNLGKSNKLLQAAPP